MKAANKDPKDAMSKFLIPEGEVDPIKRLAKDAARQAAIDALEPLLSDVEIALEARVVDRKELCVRASCTEASLSRWLARKTIPAFKEIEKLNAALWHIMEQPDKALALALFRRAKAHYRQQVAKAVKDEAAEGASA